MYWTKTHIHGSRSAQKWPKNDFYLTSINLRNRIRYFWLLKWKDHVSFIVVTASNLYIAYTKLERKLIQNTEYSPSQIKGSEYRLNHYVKGDTRAFLVTQFQIDWYILTPARVDEVVFTSPRDEITESSHIPNTK